MPAGKPIATVALGIAAAACAGAALYWWLGVENTAVYTDDGAIAASADDASPRDVLWRPPESVTPANGPLAEGTPRVSPSGDELYLSRTSADGGSDLLVAKRVGDSWLKPEPIAGLNTPDNEHGAVVSPDGGWLYFASDRPGGSGGYDIWRSPRADGAWGEPEPLGAVVNSPANELHPALAADGSLLFASDRSPTGSVDGVAGGYDVYRADLVADDAPSAIAALNSTADDVGVALSPTGDFVYLSSNRTGGVGGFDLYRARRTADGFGPLEPLGAPINTPANELEPGLAMGGFAIFYASDAAGTAGATDLQRSVSREVYLARGSRFAGLWGELLGLLPWVLALLALILLLAMLRRVHAGGAWEGRLSTLGLMARCVLASLILHALLLALLAYWDVRLAPGSPLGDEEGTRVSLVSGAGADSLGSQVRGGFTEAEVTRAESQAASPDIAQQSAREIGATELMAAADARAADRSMVIQAARPDADVRASRSAAVAAANTTPNRAQPETPVGTPGVQARAMAGESSQRIVRDDAAGGQAGAPSLTVSAVGVDGSAELVTRGAAADGGSMRVQVSAQDSGAPSTAEVMPPAASSPAASAADPMDLEIPAGAVATAAAESAYEGPARATPASVRGAPSATSIPLAGTGSSPLAPAASAMSGVQDERIAFGVEATDSTIASTVAGTGSDRDVTPAPAAAPSGTELALPSGSGASIAEEAARAAPRAGSGHNAPIAYNADAGDRISNPAMLDPGAVSARGDTVAFTGQPGGADPNRLVEPGFDTPSVAHIDAIGAPVRSPEIASPGGSAESRVEAETTRRVARATPGTNRGAPGAAVETRTRSVEIGHDAPRSGQTNNTIAWDLPGTESAPAAGEALDMPGAISDLDLGTLALGDVAMPLSQSPDDPERSAARAEGNPTALRISPVVVGRPGAAGTTESRALELGISSSRTSSSHLAFGYEQDQAEIDDDLASLRGVTTPPPSVVMPSVAVSLPVPVTPLRLTGVVLDDETGEPIAGARVRLDLIESSGIELTTDAFGAFEMGLDDVPDNIALAASADGYVPGAMNIAEDDLADDGAYAEFRLVPFNPFEIAMEDEPRVHHLGNDEYSGRINSQFQRESEGREIRFRFDLAESQLPPNVVRAEIVMLAKGVQLPNPVGVNGTRLDITLQESPDDGSFGEQRIRVPIDLLEPGSNWIAFRSIRTPGTDIDDFEFVNVRLVLEPSGDPPM